MVTGFVTYNTPAFGTVAPYSTTEGFVWPGTTPFVTLPQNSSVMSEILDVDTNERDYVFESKNSADNPVSVIIRGRVPGSSEELYYRVMLIDENGVEHSLVLEGSITYGTTASSQRAMPKDSFVVLQRVSDGARVGSFTIDSDGHYLLRLRNEYQINWDLDEYKVDFTNTAEGGKVYATENAITLPNLMANPNITLILSE